MCVRVVRSVKYEEEGILQSLHTLLGENITSQGQENLESGKTNVPRWGREVV